MRKIRFKKIFRVYKKRYERELFITVSSTSHFTKSILCGSYIYNYLFTFYSKSSTDLREITCLRVGIFTFLFDVSVSQNLKTSLSLHIHIKRVLQ